MPRLFVGSVLLLAVAMTATYTAQPQTGGSIRLLPVSGVFVPADGQRAAAAEVVTLSIYADETGGSPLWQESQRIAVDEAGRYSLLLGSTQREGLPLDLFASDEARWLAITFARPGEKEGPRTRLASVPYALHASSADTLGGLPASAYMLAPNARRDGADSGDAMTMAATGVFDPQAVLPGTTNFLAKYINNADVGNSAVFESGGRVGIGTTAPLDTMSVQFTNTTGQFTGYAVQNLGATATSYSGMLFYDQSGNLAQFQGFNNSTHEYRINNIARRVGDNEFDGTLNFLLGSVSRFYIASSGNVGFSTTSPAAPLEVVRNNSFADALFTSYGNNSSGSFIDGRKARGTVDAPLPLQANDILASFGGRGYDSSSLVRTVSVNMRAGGAWSTSSRPTYIDFATAAVGATFATERMRITDVGNVGIGVTGPTDRLQVAGDIRVGTSGPNGCVKNFNGDALVGICASDQRFKADIVAFGPVLTSLASLQPVHYTWRAAAFPERHFGDRRSYGLVAQEVEKVLPEIVVTNADGYKAVDYSKLPLLTVQAVRELKAENDAVKLRNAALDAKNAALETRVAELERQMKELLAASQRR
jgi:hypothetical protein